MVVTTSARLMSPLTAIAVAAGLLLAAGALWAYYGTAVFYEMILAGWAACF